MGVKDNLFVKCFDPNVRNVGERNAFNYERLSSSPAVNQGLGSDPPFALMVSFFPSFPSDSSKHFPLNRVPLK